MKSTQTWFFDADGYAQFPLYHGTSSYFMDSIQTNGLGGRNIVREWRVLEMHRELYVLRKRPTPPVAYHQGGLWGYGEVYLTAYEGRARKYQSELFGLTKANMYRMERTLQDELLSRYPEAAACLNAKHTPVVLRLPRLHRSALRGWASDDPCDIDSMGTFEDYQAGLASIYSVPTPTLRLRNPTHAFEVLV